jgi:hypothetical protein
VSRFDSTRGRGTKVVSLAEGVLLREMVGDPMLQQYEVRRGRLICSFALSRKPTQPE